MFCPDRRCLIQNPFLYSVRLYVTRPDVSLPSKAGQHRLVRIVLTTVKERWYLVHEIKGDHRDPNDLAKEIKRIAEIGTKRIAIADKTRPSVPALILMIPDGLENGLSSHTIVPGALGYVPQGETFIEMYGRPIPFGPLAFLLHALDKSVPHIRGDRLGRSCPFQNQGPGLHIFKVVMQIAKPPADTRNFGKYLRFINYRNTGDLPKEIVVILCPVFRWMKNAIDIVKHLLSTRIKVRVPPYQRSPGIENTVTRRQYAP